MTAALLAAQAERVALAQLDLAAVHQTYVDALLALHIAQDAVHQASVAVDMAEDRLRTVRETAFRDV